MKKSIVMAGHAATIFLVAMLSDSATAKEEGGSSQSEFPYFGKAAPPASRPSVDSVSCAQFSKRLKASAVGLKAAEYPNSELPNVFSEYLRSIGADLGASVIEAVPDDFAWWVHTLGPVSALSLGAAVHESSHMLDQFLRICGDGTARFMIGREVFITNMALGQTPRIAEFILREYPEELSLLTPVRRNAYVIRAAPGNDLIILLGEVAAYLAEAHAEIAIYQRVLAGDSLFPAFITQRNAGLSGLIDILILLKVYLRQLDSKAELTMKNITQRGDLVCFIAAAHASAKRLVRNAIDQQLPTRLGFTIGLERDNALKFAEIIDSAEETGFSYGQFAKRAVHPSPC